MNNPFDWQNYKPKIDLSDIARAQKSSYQQTVVVNRKRAAGIEPNTVQLPNSRQDMPQKFTTQMPEMPKYKRPSRSKK